MTKEFLLDFVPISQEADKIRTTVYLLNGAHDKKEWIKVGLAKLVRSRQDDWDRWTLSARLGQEATDFEHDAAHIFDLGLIGVEFGSLMWGAATFNAWIDPDPEYFRVPNAGYNPLVLPDTTTCSQCETPHPIVPQGCYVPPANVALLRQVYGHRVQIVQHQPLPKDKG